ncbi:MAG: class I tRNA ligase family protein, partial [Candidatus Pacebacteria bacterium]|nr:class I tRNA ligase family protein [Candidatus Paceibacterota bacterium]
DPKYYKWTQWIFLKLFNSFYDEKLDKARPIEELRMPKKLDEFEKRKYTDSHRLAYKKEMAINWCPSCKIGLANEEVINSTCERCGAPAEKKIMKQWILKITKYADRLIKDLDTVDYLDKIKTQQVNWIGRSEGAIVKFPVILRRHNKESRANTQNDLNNGINTPTTPSQDGNSSLSARNDSPIIEVFTTRPDTLFGCTYVVLAPEHPLIKNLESGIENLEEVKEYIKESKNKSDLDRTDLAKEKSGVELKGIKAINPVNQEEIPIWIADYVLFSYGTGAIMAVPAHDERDFEFAKKFNIDIRQVVAPLFIDKGKNKIRKDKKNTKREVVDVIIKHWNKDEYFCLDWSKSKNDWKTFIFGGVEKGENIKEAAIREAKEESGYQNMRVVKKIGNEIRSRFFAAHKDVNRHDLKRNCVYIELIDNSYVKPKIEHVKNHNGIWLKREEVKNFINLEELKIYWDIFQSGEKPFTEEGIAINSGEFNGLTTFEFKKEITSWLEKNKLGKKAINYKLRDWVFS